MKHLLYLLIFFSLRLCLAQQNYSGNSILSCNNDDKNGPSPSFLYSCNNNKGIIFKNSSCMAFLIFKSQPPYNTITTISNLTSSNPIDIARINDVTNNLDTMFQIGKEVIVPLQCSCSSSTNNTKYYYYQSKTKHVLGEFLLPETTYFNVANQTFQGLTTCDSLKRFNPYPELDLRAGMELDVPLRCACPTWNQARNGIKYLMTYSVNWGDTISSIAARFNATIQNLLEANGISMETTIFPFTTLLIPLPSEPLSSSTIIVGNVPPYNSTSPHAESGSKETTNIVLATIFSILILCIMLSLVFSMKKISERFIIKEGKNCKRNRAVSEDIRVEIASIDETHSKLYKFEEIKDATENFSSRNIIKGSVFRGEFGNKRESFAVKRRTTKGYASKEINLLRRINHFNLIKLQGYCENEGLFYLVFEFMENGSLREWLSSEENSFLHQSWSKRIEIALDIANGLQYLHNFTDPCYVHNGINSGNILLNKDLRAKIANFSLAEELSETCHTSDDVYGFGVVLLELITGKDFVTLDGLREGVIMVSRIMMNNLIDKEHEDEDEEEEEKLSLLFDPRLIGNFERESALMMVKLSLACLNQEPASRPNMSEVVSTLLKTLSVSHNNCWNENFVMLKS